MTMDEQTDTRKNFVPRLLPWLLAVVALAVYLLTLNHWVSLFNLESVARMSGWTWAAASLESAFLSRHVSVPLAAGRVHSHRAESVFRRVRRVDTRPAGAVGCDFAA